ncbi:C6 transcription factor [Hypomontagnella monticulosa]|nr:C6 transcription factor [Hypomontagnella monticulosa]
MDEFSLDPRFIELQEELRTVLLDSTKQPEPESADAGETEQSQSRLDLSRVPISKIKMVNYLKNWIVECAPYLDKFDEERNFGIRVPLLAQNSPALLYAMLAFSARQMERKAYPQKNHDSLQLYQESIRLLASSLPTKDPDMLVTACILAVLELMSGNPHSWRRHIEGCAGLFDLFGVNGLSGGLLQAVFWCYARMELCGAIISRGAESTVLPLEKWVPPVAVGSLPKHLSEDLIKSMFLEKSREAPSMHGNWAVYLCARACDLLHRRTRQLELDTPDETDTRSFFDQWHRLWADLQYWLDARPPLLQPLRRPTTDKQPLFPLIIFNHWAAISSTQSYHAACILMLEMVPSEAVLLAPYNSPTWHARRICGISQSNPHYANLINSIQPLYLAGRLLSHPSEHIEIARILKFIETATGWGALWRLRDLELEWGYEPDEILNAT